MNGSYGKLNAMVTEGIIPPFREKTCCSEFMFGTYCIIYDIDNRFTEEYRTSCTKEYIRYLKHWHHDEEGVQQEIETLQEKIKGKE